MLLLAFDKLTHFGSWPASKRLLVASLIGFPLGVVTLPMSIAEELLRRARGPLGCFATIPLLAIAYVTLVVASFEAAYVLGVAFHHSFDAGLMNLWWFAHVGEEDRSFILACLYLPACPAAITTVARSRDFTVGQQLYVTIGGSILLGAPALDSFGAAHRTPLFELAVGAAGLLAASWPLALSVADKVDARLVAWTRSSE